MTCYRVSLSSALAMTFVGLMSGPVLGQRPPIIRPIIKVLPRTVHMTPFRPDKNGFKFINSFSNDFIPALDYRTQGLCGGMSYSALDYYFTKTPVPLQPFKPANGTVLANYLYDRQTNSIMNNVDRWAELGFNPGGARDSEFFNWGLETKPGSRIAELKSFIDRGVPCVLGMQGDGHTGSHQVIAYGYDMGRYTGNLGAYQTDFKIFICDPNHPGESRTLIPSVGEKLWVYQEEIGATKRDTWRAYFVDKNYAAKAPPRIANASYPADGLTYELILQFWTGDDDLRGGNDNINVTVTMMDGSSQYFPNVNHGRRWIVNNDEAAEIILKKPVQANQIKTLLITDTFGGGIGGDNWDMTKLDIFTMGGGFYNWVKEAGFKRFTGDDKNLLVKVNDAPTVAGQANKVLLKFDTTDDDLRGGNDNLNVILKFRDGTSQVSNNVNGNGRWADNSHHEVVIELTKGRMPNDIVSVTLQTTFGGGMGGDNWNMGGVSVSAQGPGVDTVIFTHGFKRFTGDDKTLVMSHR